MAHTNRGNTLLNKGQTDYAIEHHIEALRIKPDFGEAYNNLALAFYRKGDIGMAVKHFRKALQINPNHSTAKTILIKF